MGAKVQCKSYIPGYYAMKDLNNDSNSSCSLYHEHKTFNGQIYNSFKMRPVNEYSEYDKELLKRTMLEHEAVFRKQIYELHRLYRVQKYLMDELKRKQSYRYSAPMGASHSNIFSSHMPHEICGKIWQMPHQPLANTGYRRATAPDADNKKSTLNFLKENDMRYNPISPENRGSLDDRPLDPKLQRFPKKMFDLHLPADVYIDSEDAERTEKEIVADSCVRVADTLNKIHGVEPENNVKLTLVTGDDGSCREGSWKSYLHSRGGHSIHHLADLNEPIKDLDGKGAAGSVSNGLRTQHKEVQGHLLPMKSRTNFVHRDFFIDGYGNEGSCSNFFNTEKQEIIEEWQPLHNAGRSRSNGNSFNSGSCNEKYPMSSESIQLKLKKAHETQLPDQKKTNRWFREKTSQSIEISGRIPHLVNSNHSAVMYPQMTGPLSVVSQSACSSVASPPASSWRKPAHSISHIPIAVQALPCFNGPVTMNEQKSSNAQHPSNASGKLQCNGNLKSHSQLGSKSSFLNGFRHGLQSESSTRSLLPSVTLDQPDPNNSGDNSEYQTPENHGVQKCFEDLQGIDNKSGRGVNLNRSSLNGIIDDLTAKQHLAGKHDGSSNGLPWLKTKSACNGSSGKELCAPQMELGFTKDCSQLMSRCENVAPEYASKIDKEKGFSLCVPRHSLLPSQIKESKIHRHEASDGLNSKRIPVSSILDMIRPSANYSPVSCYKQSLDDDAKFREKGKGATNHSLGNESNINLNCATYGAEAPSSLYITGVTAKIACNIDLETPINAWEGGSICSQGKIIGMNHLKKPVEISLSKDGSHETEFSCDIPLRVAAEIIISMSLDVSSHSDGITFCLSAPASCDSLQWFADAVLSSARSEGVPKGRGDGCSEHSDDGTDSFESLTLKLEAMKEDEYMCRTWEQEKPKDEQSGTAPLLLTRSRRGQARKRRQRKDFQKDILPGLASLSRHEVAEDLQILGGLMRASGKPWQTCSARQSTGRNGQTRGRRPRSLAVTVEEVHVSHLPAQPTYTEVPLGGTSMMGWGRTTRRCRRQRFPSGNASAPQK
ncbi:uncharacterized protein LOC103707454 [Phoenix dactylifera]|uniref:Uncharacterized protein LOC103707454 n=1 Tax=Phoenix dactylifera TaxID=42345 RepID=A0A8B9AT72_PHODC|nr:uncharacterized protein LOC103707454 [Phoenix dactylifera]